MFAVQNLSTGSHAEEPKPITEAERLTLELNELNVRKAPELVRLKEAKEAIASIEARQKAIIDQLNAYKK